MTRDNWRDHETWLLGVDLYNQAYWWEAHEQWEAMWRLATPGQDTAHLLQGLIQLGASLLKWDLGNATGCDRLWHKAQSHLRAVSPRVCLGVDVSAVMTMTQELLSQYPVPPAHPQRLAGPVIQLTVNPASMR